MLLGRPVFVPVAAALLLAGCGSEFTGNPEPARGQRLVTGRLVPPGPDDVARRQVALELAAVAIDARQEDPVLSVVTSSPFNPSGNGGQPVSFRVALPVEGTFVLFLQSPVDSRRGLGRLVARVLFPKNAAGDLTDLLSGRAPSSSAPLADLDLGVVKISTAGTSEPQGGDSISSPFAQKHVILGEGEAQNPLKLNDVDGDGTADLDDPDDDNDLIPDDGDLDANDDKIPDSAQVYDALAGLDGNGDQIPDIFQP